MKKELDSCKLLSSVPAVSVSVGVWTLVAISLERYFAICRPLKSRRWQTQFHAYKMIVMVWLASLIWNSPILVVSRLQAIKVTGKLAPITFIQHSVLLQRLILTFLETQSSDMTYFNRIIYRLKQKRKELFHLFQQPLNPIHALKHNIILRFTYLKITCLFLKADERSTEFLKSQSEFCKSILST